LDEHFVALAEVIAFVPAAHVAAAHVALSVQQLIFSAAASAPPAMPALVGSSYFPAAHATVLPPHFVVSFSQQFTVQAAALAMALVHFKPVRAPFSFHPAAHEPAETPTDSTPSRVTIILVFISSSPKK